MCNAWTGQIFYDPKEFYDPHPLVRQGGRGTPLADKIRQTVFDRLPYLCINNQHIDELYSFISKLRMSWECLTLAGKGSHWSRRVPNYQIGHVPNYQSLLIALIFRP